MKWNALLLKIIRWTVAALAVVLLVFSLGSKPSPDIPFENLEKATIHLLAEGQTQSADTRMIRRLYGLNPADFEGLSLQYPITNMEVDELLLVKLRDESQAETVQKAIEGRLAAQKQTFDGYGEEQIYALTHNTYTEIRGLYVLFTVGSDGDIARQVRDAFLGALKEG